MLFLLCIFFGSMVCVNMTIPKQLPVTYEKYLTYDWEIMNCGEAGSLYITKNNQTYLTFPLKSCDYYCSRSISLPWCVFSYNHNDKYEWYITNAGCNKTANKTTFNIEPFKVYYATSNLNSYTTKVYSKTYALVEIPHFTNSLKSSCMDISLKLSDPKPSIKIHKDVNKCI